MADLDDIVVIGIAPLGAPGTGITTTQYTSLDSDRNALLARANITKLDDVPDVYLTGLAAGHVPVWDPTLGGGVGGWKNQSNLEALASLKVNGAEILGNTQKLNFSSAFSGAVNGTDSTQVDLAPVFGTGLGTFRQGNQESNPMIPNRWTFAATGVLSSGSRTLSSTTSSTLVAGVTYDWTAEAFVVCRNNVSSGTVTLTITVNGSSLTYLYQCVGGVPAAMKAPHGAQSLTGAGTGVTVSASIAYDSGDASDVRAGIVLFYAYPRR